MTKLDFRKHCLNRLRFYGKVGKFKRNKIICSKILDIINLHRPKKILLYIPLDTEADISKLIKVLRTRKDIEIYVPYMTGKSFIPVKYRLPLKKKRFGIKEPNFSYFKNNEISLDMAVVPIVGIDATYRRIGFGAGMYDRFYEKLKSKPITVFTQLSLCKTEEIVTSEHDIKPDYIITS